MSQDWSAAASTIIGVAALIAAFWQIRQAWSKKSLTYSVTVTPARGVTHRGQPIGNASVVRWTLTNAGTDTIEKDDYERPVALILSAGSKPLSIELERELRPGLQPEILPERHRLIFSPQLLNAGDGFTVAAVVADFTGSWHIDGRVAGVPELTDAREERRRRLAVRGRIAAFAAVALLALIAFVAASRQPASSGASSKGLELAVRSWSIVGTPFRGQYEFVLGVNAYANNAKSVDVRLDRFRLLMVSLDAAHWSPPEARLSQGATQLDFKGRRVWAVPPTANGVSEVNPATGTRMVPSLWRAQTLARRQSYPARTPDGVMTFYLPRRDVHNNGALDRVIGLAYVAPSGRVLLISRPSAWGPRRPAAEV